MQNRPPPLKSSLSVVRYCEQFTLSLEFSNFTPLIQALRAKLKGKKGKTPLEYQDTEAGYHIIKNFIARLEHSVIA